MVLEFAVSGVGENITIRRGHKFVGSEKKISLYYSGALHGSPHLPNGD
jgi:hypothetical protein